jgi:hypothetical protein
LSSITSIPSTASDRDASPSPQKSESHPNESDKADQRENGECDSGVCGRYWMPSLWETQNPFNRSVNLVEKGRAQSAFPLLIEQRRLL